MRRLTCPSCPKDNPPACSAEACAFRVEHEASREAGATVIGVSSDSLASHGRFAGRFGLPYLLLGDPDGSARRAFGIPRTFGLIPGRTTYLIDREGVVRHVFSSQFQPARHVAVALTVLKAIGGRDDSVDVNSA